MHYRRYSPSSAFTLIELLVVIAIIAILAVVVVLTLNPAQLLAQSRDATRVSDLATLNSALNLYVVDQTGGNIGTANVTSVSLPDPTATTTAGTNCSGLGSNFPTSGTAFDCSASSTFRKIDNTGWIPVNFSSISAGSPFASLPVDPTNSTSSNLYYSYQANGSTFRLVATPESQKYQTYLASSPSMFMAGANAAAYGTWVLVPGNSTFGTGNFYVMKYDASCINRTTGVSLTTPTDTTAVYGYNNGGSSATPNNCSLTNGFAPASIATGYPIVDVSQTQAANYCSSIGAHLITNNEWQTIAWNLESVASNWGTNTVGGTGTGAMYSGHNDGTPNNALTASSDDTDGYYGTNNTSGTQRRTLTLSNGAVIWDMAGNLWQWTNDQIASTSAPTPSGVDWPSVSYSGSTLSQTTAGPLNGNNWTRANGIGFYYGGTANPAGFLRGGNWTGGSAAGVETLNLGNGPSLTNSYIGFRCAR